MALHIPTGTLKSHSGFEPVPTSPLADDIATAPSGSVLPLSLDNALNLILLPMTTPNTQSSISMFKNKSRFV